MSTVGDVFVNGFDSIEELKVFLLDNMEVEVNRYFTDHIALSSSSIGFDLHLWEDHEMENDQGIEYSDYRYLIIVDSYFKPKGFPSAYDANYGVSKYIEKLFIKNNKQTIALIDMQRII